MRAFPLTDVAACYLVIEQEFMCSDASSPVLEYLNNALICIIGY